MLKTSLLAIVGITLLGAASVPANAAIISVSGDGSIISAPESVFDDNPGKESNEFMLGFDEKQNVLLGADLKVDSGVIAKNTRVNSHMIFLNTIRNFRQELTASWTFDGKILGVMSDKDGKLEGASGFLGADGTSYPTPKPNNKIFNNRGFENQQDKYAGIGTDTLEVSMLVTEPGDWIRVVTEAKDVPEPASMLSLLAFGAIGASAVHKRKQASA